MPTPELQGSSLDKDQKIEELEKELADLKKQLENLNSGNGTSLSKDSDPLLVLPSGRNATQSVQNLDIGRLYGWNRGRRITNSEVMDVVNKLKEPYNTEISNFIKNKDIMGLQKYLNQKIREGKIDKVKLTSALKAKKIRFNGSILEDGKFGPQTLETIKFILEEDGDTLETGKDPKHPFIDTMPKIITNPRIIQPTEPTNPEQREKMKGDLDWIIQEMADEISGIVDTNSSKRWSAERLVLDTENFKVDTKNKTITIETRGTSLNSPERAHNSNNRCEYNWTTGQVFVYVGNRRYTMPMKLQALRLDSTGLPDGKQVRNRQVVEAFARVGNLMNNLKAHGVYNQTGALEEESGGIEVNNGVMGVKDTQLISKSALDNLRSKYSHVGVRFDTVELAGMLTAMKLDLGKIKWTPDIESGSWMRKNPLDEEHIKYVKRYSQTYGR